MAEHLAKEASNPTWTESIEDLWSLLYSRKVWVRMIVDNARFAEDVRVEWKRSTYSLIAAPETSL